VTLYYRPFLLAATAATTLFVASVPATTLAGGKLPAQVASTPVPSLAPMVKRVSPSVVNIQTRGKVRAQRNPLMDDPFFRRFFNVPEGPAEREFRSAGSGVVVDAKQGYLITNAHVIGGARRVQVLVPQVETGAPQPRLKPKLYPAEVIGLDRETDIAVLKIAVKQAKPLAF